MAILLFVTSAAFAENFVSGEIISGYGVIGYGLDLEAVTVQPLLGLDYESPAADGADAALDILVGCRVIKSLLESSTSYPQG